MCKHIEYRISFRVLCGLKRSCSAGGNVLHLIMAMVSPSLPGHAPELLEDGHIAGMTTTMRYDIDPGDYGHVFSDVFGRGGLDRHKPAGSAAINITGSGWKGCGMIQR